MWWHAYGSECKELQRLAERVLSLTCSATGCERNWSTFELIHSKRRNRLEQLRLNALVYVKYNLRLQQRKKERDERGDTYDPICLSDLDSDDEWISEIEPPLLDPTDTDWMDIHELFEKGAEITQKKRKKSGPRDLRGKGKKPATIAEEEEEEELLGSDDDEDTEEEEEGDLGDWGDGSSDDGDDPIMD